jgi:chemotaxis protein methyltransferase CheR
MVKYQQFNLLGNPATLGRFDVIFCRNVLIYFDPPTKTQIFSKLADIMPEDGFLYLGGAETVLGMSDRFQLMPEQRGIYRLVQSGAKPAAQAAS